MNLKESVFLSPILLSQTNLTFCLQKLQNQSLKQDLKQEKVNVTLALPPAAAGPLVCHVNCINYTEKLTLVIWR